MNDAQTWTAIGGLLVVLLAFVGLIVRLLGEALTGKLGVLDVKLGALGAKMDAGFANIERRVDGLDRDVAAITRRLFDGQ